MLNCGSDGEGLRFYGLKLIHLILALLLSLKNPPCLLKIKEDEREMKRGAKRVGEISIQI